MIDAAPNGHLAENVAYFARALAEGGAAARPEIRARSGCRPSRAGPLGGKKNFYWTLHAVLVKKREHSVLFDQAFRIFWRRRMLMEKMMQSLMRMTPGAADEEREKASKRVADALYNELPPPEPEHLPPHRARRSSSTPASPCRIRGVEIARFRADVGGRDRGRQTPHPDAETAR